MFYLISRIERPFILQTANVAASIRNWTCNKILLHFDLVLQPRYISKCWLFSKDSLVRHDEMQKCPQFLETILQRCASDEQSVVCVELCQRLVQKWVVIFQPMSFVHQQCGPADASQERLVFQHDFVSSYHCVYF